MKAIHLGASRTGHQANDEQCEVLLTQDEVAARLKVGLRTLVRLQHDGAVPFIVLGKSVRFYWPAVVSHLNANATVCRCVPHGPSPQIPKLK